jgi:hypothetical protein
MQVYETIRAFYRRNVAVIVEAVEEPDLDLSFDDNGEVRAKLESGELQAFAVRVRVLVRGNTFGEDFLGGCIYKTPAEFQDHRQCAAETRKLRASGSAAVCGSYFSDMVHNAIADARTELRRLAEVKVRL